MSNTNYVKETVYLAEGGIIGKEEFKKRIETCTKDDLISYLVSSVDDSLSGSDDSSDEDTESLGTY
jgi:hypothetical protein